MEHLLTFYAVGKTDFTLELSLYPSTESPLSFFEQEDLPYAVYGDVNYRFVLEGTYPQPVIGASVCVNEEWLDCFLEGKVISFPQKNGLIQYIFMDSFGFAEVSIQLTFADKTTLRLYAPPLPVLVREDAVSRSVKSMADYVFCKQESLLQLGNFTEKQFDGKETLEEHSLESYIVLAEEILESYETSFYYFKTNCRFKMEQVDVVDRMEKLQRVTPRTIAYTAQHPEYLKRVRGTTGISVGGQVYLPERTLVTQNVYSKDIYENRVVVGFLHAMLQGISGLMEQVGEMGANFSVKEEEEEVFLEATTITQWEKRWNQNSEGTQTGGKRQEEVYVPSHHCILEKMTGVLKDSGTRLQQLHDRFLNMTLQYHKIMNFDLGDWLQLETTPKPTAVLLSVPQYHKIFLRMHQWFDCGLYDFGKEKNMLSFLRISDLYEYFLLMKMVEFFQDDKWEREPFVSFVAKDSGKNTQQAFLFRKGKEKVILYFRPKIYDSDHNHWNMTGLYRNNTHSLTLDGEKGNTGIYYEPDFVLKVQNEDGTVRYVIMDAKFSGSYTVREHYLLPLLYKYMFSLSTISQKESIVGLAVFYGKCGITDYQESVYNKQMSAVRPFAEMVPMVEGVSEGSHFNRFLRLLDMARYPL